MLTLGDSRFGKGGTLGGKRRSGRGSQRYVRTYCVLATIAFLTVLVAPTATAEPVAEVALASRSRHIDYGERFPLRGSVSSDVRSCVAQVDLVIYEDAWDDIAYNWTKVKTITTDGDGDFTGFVRPNRSANYRVQLQSPSPCGEARSKTRTARVHITVQLRVEAAGERNRVDFTAIVSPACPQRAHNRSVRLEKLVDGAFRLVASKVPDEECKASFRRRVPRTATFRVTAPRVQSVAFVYFRGTSQRRVVSPTD